MRKLLLLTTLALAFSAIAADAPVITQQILSPVYTIDKIYRSMEGPGNLDRIYLGDPKNPELLWIVSVKTEMVGEDGKTPQLPELMCHVNVDLDTQKHRVLFNLKRPVAPRLITLSQGMLEATFPPGYGYPIASNEPLSLYTQVLNHNIEHPNGIKVRHRVTFTYIRDKDLVVSLKPLFNLGVSGLVQLDNNPNALASMPSVTNDIAQDASKNASSSSADHAGHGASCLLLPRAPNAMGQASDYTDPQGRKMTGHWVVPPGHQVNKSDITWFLGLPYDVTALHYAAVHLHPFAQSLTIRDTTTGQTIFEAKAQNPKEGIGLTHVDTFTSAQGVPLYRNHKYELISVYDNPTNENRDSMASAFLSVDDPEFVKPDGTTLAVREASMLDFEKPRDTIVVVRTSLGDFEVKLARDKAPGAVRQFLRMVRVGAYDHAVVAKIDTMGAADITPATVTDIERALLMPIRPETTLKHMPGVVSICPGSVSFSVVLTPMPQKDGTCSAFGEVSVGGLSVLRAMSISPLDERGVPKQPIEVTKVDLYDASTGAALTTAAKGGM